MLQAKGIIEIGRFRIAYRTVGSGEDIVCLNGAQQSMAMWYSFLRRFSNRYRITLFDFPHQGKSVVTYGPADASLDEQVQILAGVLQELRITRPTICSASWGGVVALLFALRFPMYAKRLVLASFGMRPNARMREIILKGVHMDRNNREEMAQVLINAFGERLPQMIKKQIISQFKSMPEERIEAFSQHGLSILFYDSLDKVMSLSQINTPVVVLYGENDRIIDFEDVKSLSSFLPYCEIITVAGAGHFLHLENERVFDIYERVLASCAVDLERKSPEAISAF